MKKFIAIVIMITFLMVGFSGCSDNRSSEITVEIDSSYDYDAIGDLFVDGERYCGAYSNANEKRTYYIHKSELNLKSNSHTIILSLTSGGVEQTAIAYNVTEYVKFFVGGKSRMAEYGWTEDHYIEVEEYE